MRDESYNLEWRSRKGTNKVKKHENVDTEKFTVRLASSDLAVLYREVKLLECRVDIQHAPGRMGTYCGQGIRAAGEMMSSLMRVDHTHLVIRWPLFIYMYITPTTSYCNFKPNHCNWSAFKTVYRWALFIL